MKTALLILNQEIDIRTAQAARLSQQLAELENELKTHSVILEALFEQKRNIMKNRTETK